VQGCLVRIRFTRGWRESSNAGSLQGKIGMCLGRAPVFPELNYWAVLVGTSIHHLLEENFEVINEAG
jgi:hypothetical protein